MRPTRATGSFVALLGLALSIGASQAAASPYTPLGAVESSATNVYADCPPDGSGVNFANSEVEPWLDVNPANQSNLATFYQQDRYSNGGSKSNAMGVSFNAGATWTQVAVPQNTRCSDGGEFERASDPWTSFSPNGVLHSMSLVTDPDPPSGGFGDNGMVANRSFDGGLTWEASKQLITDRDRRHLNDKNSLTADPNNSAFVYAVWDRLQIAGGDVQQPENRRGLGFKGPVYFTRSTNNGATYEAPRKILETGANKQTIGNQIVVEPASDGGSLFDFFDDITNSSNRLKGIGPLKLAFIRSDNHGSTWTKVRRVDDMLPMALFRFSGVIDPESPPTPCPEPDPQGNCPVRAADLIPDVAVNRSNGDLYAVWQDVRFDGVGHDQIAFTQSTDGGNSWSAPIKVNQTPTTEPEGDQQAFTPSVHVANDGTIAVSYFDFRNNTSADGILGTDHWVVHCHPASENCANPASWNEETRATNTTFDMRQTPFARGYFVGDYMGLASRRDPVTGDDEFLSTFGAADTPPTASSIFTNRLVP
jgi:hypothetical protein